MKDKYDWLKTFQQGLGKKVARKFFLFTTETAVTKSLYSNRNYGNNKKGYTDKNVNRLCKKWNELGFFETVKRQITIENRWGATQKMTVINKRLNFKPLYFYLEEIHRIKLTRKEKDFLEKKELNIIHLQWQRKKILDEYPHDNIIDAVIKFYVKNLAVPPIEILDKEERKILDMLDRHCENELSSNRKRPSPLSEYFDNSNLNSLPLKKRKEWSEKFDRLFPYVLNYKKNPEVVSSLNANFKKALGII